MTTVAAKPAAPGSQWLVVLGGLAGQAARKRVFQPFCRLGTLSDTTGVGLGLAVARGLAETMGGTLEPENTPGGGLTMVLMPQAAAQKGMPESIIATMAPLI